MKRILVLGLLVICLVVASQSRVSAWTGGGPKVDLSYLWNGVDPNAALWGLWRDGQPPGPYAFYNPTHGVAFPFHEKYGASVAAPRSSSRWGYPDHLLGEGRYAPSPYLAAFESALARQPELGTSFLWSQRLNMPFPYPSAFGNSPFQFNMYQQNPYRYPLYQYYPNR